jgi:hypothetical protein
MEAFRVVQNFFRVPLELNHTQQVTRLYRRTLRTLDSWTCDRELFHKHGAALRHRFDKNKAVDSG